MTHLYGLHSCFYDNCDKKNNNKRKGRKKTRKKTHVRRDLNVGPLSQHYGFTTRPRGLSHLYLACSVRIFFLRKRMLKLEKRGESGASQKERGRGREERRENACPKTLWKWKTPAINYRAWPLFRKWEADQSTPNNYCTGSSLHFW